jgi:hypothetical protein
MQLLWRTWNVDIKAICRLGCMLSEIIRCLDDSGDGIGKYIALEWLDTTLAEVKYLLEEHKRVNTGISISS